MSSNSNSSQPTEVTAADCYDNEISESIGGGDIILSVCKLAKATSVQPQQPWGMRPDSLLLRCGQEQEQEEEFSFKGKEKSESKSSEDISSLYL